MLVWPSALAASRELGLHYWESYTAHVPMDASPERLKELGVRLSLDDFGTGYSSLSYLHRFPTSAVKIDRSFITNIGPRGENAAIVRTIVNLAHNLGMKVIAEGVETEDQRQLLLDMGCEFGQGYLFSRPVEGAVVESRFAEELRAEGGGPTRA